MDDAYSLLNRASKLFMRWAENSAPGASQLPPAGIVQWLEECDALLAKGPPAAPPVTVELTRWNQDMDGSMEPEEGGRWVRYEEAIAMVRAAEGK